MVKSSHTSQHEHGGSSASPYRMFWINMALGLIVMYVVMFSMIDGVHDFRITQSRRSGLPPGAQAPCGP